MLIIVQNYCGKLGYDGFVHTRRLELPRPYGHEPLKPARLPIPPCVQ